MRKRTTATASGAAKRRKSTTVLRKPGPGRVGTAAPARDLVAANDKSTIRRLKVQLARAQARIAELQATAETDFLLDILNRRGFERELARAIAFIQRYHASGAVIVLDVDRLKPINDAFGHAAGDEVLKAIVAALSGVVRASDVIGRLGGDEFAILLWNLGETDARAKAAMLEDVIDRLTFVFRDSQVSAGASAGVAILGTHSDVERALDEADRAMYVRKAQRRHQTQG
ncbi:GGDEF domain-containing protein [Bradyrhizobium sp. ISRA464]|nr:GGDEF domain-containing protein [Bradyrhizobium sp. ISRA464]WGS27080.1 GGDEF domain-containing protein [Bradyrhizobium sp. ISRA464]